MVDMSNQCPRCGSEKKELRSSNSRSEFFTSFGESKSHRIHTKTYKCSDCGLIYTQEVRVG